MRTSTIVAGLAFAAGASAQATNTTNSTLPAATNGTLSGLPVDTSKIIQNCQSAFTSVLPVLDPCGFSSLSNELAKIVQGGTTPTDQQTIAILDQLTSTATITSFCSDACNTAMTNAIQALNSACGTTQVTVADSTNGIPALTVSDVLSVLKYGRTNMVCAQDGGKYCIPSQYAQLKTYIVTSSGTINRSGLTDAQVTDLTCTACTNKEVTALLGDVKSLPASLQTPVTTELQSIQTNLSKCPADKLKASTDKQSGAANLKQIGSGVAAAIAAFAAALVA